MPQRIINVGSTANDGTGDSIRGAFQNVNNNFTEVYSNVSNAFVLLTLSYDKANSANLLAYNTGIVSNNWANTISVITSAASNNWTNSVSQSINAYALSLEAAGNTWANTVGTAGNNYMLSVTTAGNNFTITSISSGNAWSNTIGTAGNNYTNSVGAAGNNWSLSTFATRSNVSQIYDTTNASFDLANTKLANTSGTFNGSLTVAGALTVTGVLFDQIGPVRTPVIYSGEVNNNVQFASTLLIANNTQRIYVNIDNEGRFLANAINGATITIVQYGSGQTILRANDAFVTLLSANNWLNVATQYAEVKLTKVTSNTWVVTGNLKA